MTESDLLAITGEVVDATPFVDPMQKAIINNALGSLIAHNQALQVTVEMTRRITLPTIRAYEFTPDELADLAAAKTLTISDKATHERGWNLLKRIRATAKKAAAHYDGLKKPFNDVRGAILDMDKRDASVVDGVDGGLAARIRSYDDAEAERERREAERLQIEQDALARQEQQQSADALKAVARQEPDPAVRRALVSEAKAIENAPVVADEVKVESHRAKVSGGFYVITWTGKVTNKMLFLKAVIMGKIPLDVIEIRQSWVDAQATSNKENTSKVWPFITASWSKDVRTRGR